MIKVFLKFFLFYFIFSIANSTVLDDQAKQMGFNNWTELTKTASKCRSMMMSGFPKMSINCKSGDLNCQMKEIGIYQKKFNNHFNKIVASNKWKNARCEVWMLGGGGSRNKVEELEDRIEDLEEQIEDRQN